MKTNTLHFVSGFCTLGAIAFIIVGDMGTALAQNTVPDINPSDLNGLFSPTAADRFFEQGRRDMERQIQILANPERYSPEGILQINTIDIKVIEETGETKPIDNFPETPTQYELD